MASLYLHIPFCEHKCIYCDFYSIENLSGLELFLSALEREIKMYKPYANEESFETIFFGGGTPSLLTPPQLEKVLSLLYATFRVAGDAEITVETNPGTIDAQKLADYRSLGVNRLSIGIQSFHDDELRFLTRIHSADQAKECVRIAQRVGFTNVSIDLIFALPKQTLERWQSNVRQALKLGTQHISAYSLIVEQGTPLARMVASKQVAPLPVEEDAEFYEWTMEALESAGYEHYEVSNYAKPGFRSRHNSNYWHHSNYLGFGPSAHSSWNVQHLRRRWWNIANLRTYVEKVNSRNVPVAGEEVLSEEQVLEEAVMLGLRSDGINLERIRQSHGLNLLEESPTLVYELLERGLAIVVEGTLRLTHRGYLVCDAIAERLLSELSRKGNVNQRLLPSLEQPNEVV